MVTRLHARPGSLAAVLALVLCVLPGAARAAGMDDLPGPGAADADGLAGIPTVRERRIGARMASRLLGAIPPIEDTAVQRYVNHVGRWVANQSDRADLDWTFAVLDTPAINGFAAPGGYVFITRGLLLLMESEAELAAVLGHEIAHVTQRDHLKALQARRGLEIAVDLLQHTVRGRASDRQLLDLADRAARLYTVGLSKQDEYDADRIGAALAARAGYDPWGLTHTLTTLNALDPVAPAMSLHSGTHPPPRARRETVVNALGILLDERAPGARPVQRFRTIQERLTAE